MKKLFKNILFIIVSGLFRIIQFLISITLFPLVFLWRHKAYSYVEKHGNMGWHPLQWCNWFFTKEGRHGDWYTGPSWYMKNVKQKYFTKYTNEYKDDPIPQNLKEKFIYFLIAYRWCAIRNFMWNLKRIIHNEGGIWAGADENSINVVIHDLKLKKPHIDKTNISILPSLKYVNEHNIYMNNKGPYICYPYDTNHEVALTRCSCEGVHFGWFITAKNRERFNYRKVVIKPLPFIKRLFVWEFFIGWSYMMGWLTFHFKFHFKKWDKKAKTDHENYIKNIS